MKDKTQLQSLTLCRCIHWWGWARFGRICRGWRCHVELFGGFDIGSKLRPMEDISSLAC